MDGLWACHPSLMCVGCLYTWLWCLGHQSPSGTMTWEFVTGCQMTPTHTSGKTASAVLCHPSPFLVTHPCGKPLEQAAAPEGRRPHL